MTSSPEPSLDDSAPIEETFTGVPAQCRLFEPDDDWHTNFHSLYIGGTDMPRGQLNAEGEERLSRLAAVPWTTTYLDGTSGYCADLDLAPSLLHNNDPEHPDQQRFNDAVPHDLSFLSIAIKCCVSGTDDKTAKDTYTKAHGELVNSYTTFLGVIQRGEPHKASAMQLATAAQKVVSLITASDSLQGDEAMSDPDLPGSLHSCFSWELQAKEKDRNSDSSQPGSEVTQAPTTDDQPPQPRVPLPEADSTFNTAPSADPQTSDGSNLAFTADERDSSQVGATALSENYIPTKELPRDMWNEDPDDERPSEQQDIPMMSGNHAPAQRLLRDMWFDDPIAGPSVAPESRLRTRLSHYRRKVKGSLKRR